jgi:lysophospholipase L1-like esterase
VTTTSPVPAAVSGSDPPAAEAARGALWPILVVAAVVVLLAELTVRLVQPALAVPNVWPQPELQKKFAQIGTLKHRPPDVVLVGDSGMDAGGDADGLMALAPGTSVYNASVAGAVLPEIDDWTNKIVVPRLHPKVVVIGLSSNELNPHILVAGSTVAYNRSRVVQAADGSSNLVDRADAWLRQWSMLYRYRTVLRDPFAKDTSKNLVFDPKLTVSGRDLAFADEAYLQQGGPAGAQLVLAGVKGAYQGFSVGAVNIAILQAMIDSLRHRGIQVVLLAMPITPVAVSFHPRGMEDYQQAMDSFAAIAARSGIAFEQPGIWPTSLFADPIHLNAAGTAQFTNYLSGVLQSQVRPPGP